MQLFPAIDLRGGQVVRLTQGDYDRMTVYGQDPCAQARSFVAAGAKNLHVVDLDGAKDGTLSNYDTIAALAKQGGLYIEVGGGIRTEKDVENCFALGAARVILGSAAIENPGFAADMAAKYGADRVAVSLDARGDQVASHGWTDSTGRAVLPFAEELVKSGVSVIVYTAISRDGMLTGPNFDMLGKLNAIPGISLIASGGMAAPDDLRRLSGMGLYGAICGKALYENKITMDDIRNIQEA